MKRSRAKHTPSKGSRRNRRATSPRSDNDVVTIDDIDWNTTLEVEVDPKLAEAIRSRARLRQITLRVGTDQVEEARRVAARTGVPYQAVLQRWLAEGASLPLAAEGRLTTRRRCTGRGTYQLCVAMQLLGQRNDVG